MSNLEIQNKYNTLVIDSRLVAQELGISHKALKSSINSKEEMLKVLWDGELDPEDAGDATGLLVKMTDPKNSDGTGGDVYYFLNEAQTRFVMTLSANTDQVVKAKFTLVQNFEKAKKMLKENNNDIIFQLVNSVNNLTNKINTMEERSIKTEKLLEASEEERSRLNALKKEVDEIKRLEYLLKLSKDKFKDTDYLEGISCAEYCLLNHPNFSDENYPTLQKRTASLYRQLEGKDPDKNNNGVNIYRGKKVAYILVNISQLMNMI